MPNPFLGTLLNRGSAGTAFCRLVQLVAGCFLFSVQSVAAQDSSGLRISLLTCGPGTEFIGASFGHTAIRIVDSQHNNWDQAYNYGTFIFDQPNFALRFARGNLEYSLSRYDYEEFLQEYASNGRGVWEQVLQLSGPQKVRLRELLEENLQPLNRGYIYSSVYDNCATRVRDIFQLALGDGLNYGCATTGNSLTYRQAFNPHLTADPWEKFGINILTGTNVDKVMSNKAAMYLPEYLYAGVQGAILQGHPLVAEHHEILPQRIILPPESPFTPPFWVLLCASLITIFLMVYPLTHRFGMRLGYAWAFLTGVLGILMLVMWFGTDHKICQNNLNLLWALPTNVVLPFMRRPRQRYALLAMLLILLIPVLHVLRIQHFPLGELWPLLLGLLFLYGMIVRRGDTGYERKRQTPSKR